MSVRTISLVLVAALALGACSQDAEKDETTRDESGDVVGEGDVGALSLQVGDCVESGGVGSVTDLPVVPCDEPHQSEVIAVFDLPDGDFPGASEASAAGEQGCTGDAFADYVGVDYRESIFRITYLVPTEQTWDAADDREVVCLAEAPAGEELSGSIKGRAE